jgi:hypothetical protein
MDEILKYVLDYITKFENFGAESVQHKHYKRTVEIAEEGYAYRTNQVQHMLKRVVMREDEKAFEQRLRLTHSVVGAIYNQITQPIHKVFKVGAISKRIEVGEGKEKIIQEINDSFYETSTGGKGVDAYLESIFAEVSKYDPNAAIIYDWSNEDITKTTVVTPEIIFSKEIWDFKRVNGGLKYITRNEQREVVYKKKQGLNSQEVKETFHTFTHHVDDFNVEAKRVTQQEIPTLIGGTLYTVLYERGTKKETRYYYIKIFETKAPINVTMVGYLGDPQTNQETFITPFHYAFSYIQKIIKSNSELDLAVALHVFPQKIQYVDPCMGERIGTTDEYDNVVVVKCEAGKSVNHATV